MTHSEPAFVRVATRIREELITGRLSSGTALVEAELVANHGVSRNTAREALRLLREQGLVEHIPHRGVRVRRLGAREVSDIFNARRTLEVAMLARRKPPAGAARLAAMTECVERQERAQDDENWQTVGTDSLRFHQQIVALGDSQALDDLFTLIVAQLRLVFASGRHEAAFQAPWVARDRQILDLLVAGQNRQAADELADYLEQSEHVLLASL